MYNSRQENSCKRVFSYDVDDRKLITLCVLCVSKMSKSYFPRTTKVNSHFHPLLHHHHKYLIPVKHPRSILYYYHFFYCWCSC